MAKYNSLFSEQNDFLQEETRLNTFLLWPEKSLPSASKELMAKTGLYYTGDGDAVKCHHCNIIMKDWKEGECPFEKHKASCCEFLQQLDIDIPTVINDSDHTKLNTIPHPRTLNELKHENERLQNRMLCVKCKKNKIDTLFLPCRHLITCERCAEPIDECIECLNVILGTVRVYLSS